ncbi:hypothetical protein [Arthrobacter sp. NPDC093139]|uniref:hypothetical protein n=1 Tax=Arthrobacter sp. NPDC093139 TaxID=3363945 RepID=UPI003825D315
MGLPIRRRAHRDAAIAMAAFLVAGTWLMAGACGESGPLMYAELVAGAAVMGSAAFTILGRRPPLITPADRVTLVRTVLVACCAAMTAAAILGDRRPGVLFTAAGWLRPALRGKLRASRSRKVIGAYQPIAFLLALMPGLPEEIGFAALALAFVALTASFGRDIVELERGIYAMTASSSRGPTIEGSRLSTLWTTARGAGIPWM